MPDYVPIAIFLGLGVAFTTVVLIAAWLVSPHKPKPEKLTTYECGERPVGQAWSQFNVRFYIFALMFVIFDVETVFIFPWAVRLHYFRGLNVGVFLLIEMVVFVLILALGLAYAWRKGVLKWI
ncbi:MAG TPA: NADH-quinone oxidoreductase subunit A [Armatimonadota bacterium]|nr:NADH-quinone oxidoreductase subunit A [Armatimonadota bacterium]